MKIRHKAEIPSNDGFGGSLSEDPFAPVSAVSAEVASPPIPPVIDEITATITPTTLVPSTPNSTVSLTLWCFDRTLFRRNSKIRIKAFRWKSFSTRNNQMKSSESHFCDKTQQKSNFVKKFPTKYTATGVYCFDNVLLSMYIFNQGC